MTSLLTPFTGSEPVDLGNGVWRKEVYRYGPIDYRDSSGKLVKLNFTPDLSAKVAAAFDAKAFDQVPFQIATGEKPHDENARYTHGDVQKFIPTADGLDMVVKLSAEGDELVRRNPKLGVSARIQYDYARSDGQKWPVAIKHVAATLDPVKTGSSPWQEVNLSNDDTGEVIDLSTEEYTVTQPIPEGTPDEQASTLLDRLSDEDVARLAAAIGDTDDEPEDAPAVETPEPVAASLSHEDRTAIDLANERVTTMERQLATERADREADALLASGVPPAMVNLARPALAQAAQTVDLANGEATDTGAIIRGLLHGMEGTVNLGHEAGHSNGSAENDEQKALMEKWDKDFR